MSKPEPRIYAQCGLRIRSEVALQLPHGPGTDWDVDVRWAPDIHDTTDPPPGEVIAAYEVGDTNWYTVTWTGSDYRLRFRDCGEFVVSQDLSEVQVRRDPSGEVELLPILLAGTVSAFVLTLRGHMVLHASAVAIDGAVLAFVGQSGRGKSTVAALLCVDGAELVTDDVLTVDPGPPVTCTGGACELRLRAKAAVIAQAQPAAAIRATADERLAFSPTLAPLTSFPLAGIVIPAPAYTAPDVEVTRLEPSAALFALLSFPRVYGWRRRDVLEREFTGLSQLVNRIPVFDVTIPWGPPFSPQVAPAMRELATSEVGLPLSEG